MTNGASGPLPDYYTTLKVARYLRVPPWELVTQPQYWTQAALITMQADAEIKAKHQEKQERKNRQKRG